MKAHVIGLVRIEGVSAKSGTLKPYDMPRLLILQPVEIAGKEDTQTGTRYSKSGFGFESAEIDLDPSSIPRFADVKFPAVLELEIGQRMQFGKLASICTGISGK